MPEGHTIHALAARLNRAFAGRTVEVSSPQGRFAESAALLDGTRFEAAEAWGKHLFVRFADDRVVHVHLGLIGNFAVQAGPASDHPVVGQVRLRIDDADHTADLRGPMVCALITPAERDAVVGKLGPDPLRDDADPELAWRQIHAARRSVAELVMDQAVVAGIGNVYRCELLFRHRVDPATPGSRLTRPTWDALWADLVRLLRLGAAHGQIITLDADVDRAESDLKDPQVVAAAAALTGRRLGDRYARAFHCYQRTGEPCLVCGTSIAARKVAGRVLYWCPTCQTGR